ncbi:MAG: glutamine-hydrolyzing carbamoyl-phosphate synthase small subunit [Bacillaceae bacterium]|nr:glutamine-hydrolyzing carbamoyl-phosphate synthase small subunit [Bacillaceae bacterium]
MGEKQARLILENGVVFRGTAFGHETDSTGEVVFNTGMTGYQEILTDPSYCGQIVTMTYPLIGNYGINRNDFESIRPYVHGFVVKEYAEFPSNWRSGITLDQFLKEFEIPGIAGIDTRKLTRIIREHGTLKGMITTSGESDDVLINQLKETPLMTNQVEVVSTGRSYRCPAKGPRVVLIDYGSKQGILRELVNRGCDVTVVPYNVTADEIRRIQPDGIMLSNGPGDPKNVPGAADTIRELLGDYPIFGICLGHQLFALASGADTEKMKFGHRGSNHPVKDLKQGRVYITSQNHGYAVSAESVAQTDLEITHLALNDETVEGLKHKKYPAFSVQYHPEASPGPEDSSYLFDQFMDMMQQSKGVKQHA